MFASGKRQSTAENGNLTRLRRAFEHRVEAKHYAGREGEGSLTSLRSFAPHAALVIMACFDCNTCPRQQREEEVEWFKPTMVLQRKNRYGQRARSHNSVRVTSKCAQSVS